MTNVNELRKLDLAELQTRLQEEKKSVAKLVIEQGSSKIKDLHVAKKIRHSIARLKLIISEKELLS